MVREAFTTVEILSPRPIARAVSADVKCLSGSLRVACSISPIPSDLNYHFFEKNFLMVGSPKIGMRGSADLANFASISSPCSPEGPAFASYS